MKVPVEPTRHVLPSEWHEQQKISYVCANLIAIKEGPRQGGLLLI